MAEMTEQTLLDIARAFCDRFRAKMFDPDLDREVYVFLGQRYNVALLLREIRRLRNENTTLLIVPPYKPTRRR